MRNSHTHYRSGKFYEKLAGFFLLLKGYKIIQYRYKTVVGEIDILACKGKTLIAVEVKGRKTMEASYYALSLFQKRRIQQTLLIAQKQFSHFKHLRCDTILISSFKWPIHIKNAF
ncbi:MAG: YraN family protein [Alphaproteobacteria bacterium]|nr:YraN family protein [Alphaproteobacteria bacterium]